MGVKCRRAHGTEWYGERSAEAHRPCGRNFNPVAYPEPPAHNIKRRHSGTLGWRRHEIGGAVMVEDRKAFEQRQQNIILKDRRRLMVSGVRHVESFNEECIVLDTENGLLVIRGAGLHINKLNVETSELDVEGDICAMEYLDEGVPQRKGGFFSGLFR